MSEADERASVVEIAKTWLSTPYHHMGRIKGVGADCATFIAGVFEEAGLIPHLEIAYYSPQFMLHRSTESYLGFVEQYAHEVEEPLPGDVVLWKFGRCFSHGAIVIEWPKIIHAYLNQSVVLEDALAARWLVTIGEATDDHGKPRPRRYMSYWGA